MELWKRNLYLTWLAQMLVMIGFTSVLPFVPLYIQTMGLNSKEAALWTGVMVSLSFVVMGIAAPIWGALSDRYGRKSMLLRSMVAGSLIILAMSFTNQVWQVFGLRIMQGAFAGSVTAAIALVASITPRQKMGFSLGLMQTAVFSGQSIGPLLGGFLAEHLGYQAAFLITCSLMFGATALVWLFVKEEFTPKIIEAGPNSNDSRNPLQKFAANWTQFAGYKGFMTMALVLAMLQFTTFILTPVLPIFVQGLPGGLLKSAGMGVSSITGLIFGVTGITSALSSIVAGRLSDKLGHRVVLIFSTATAAVLYLPQIFVTDTFQLLVMRGLTGLCIGGIIPSANAIIGQLTPPEKRGTAYGVAQSIASIGQAAGPLTGALVVATLDAHVVFGVTAVMFVVVCLWVRRVISTNFLAANSPNLQVTGGNK